MAITKVQLKRLAQGKLPKANVSPFFSLIGDQIETNKRTKRYIDVGVMKILRRQCNYQQGE